MPVDANGLVITSLRGGMNDADPSLLLPEDQCLLMQNVEVFLSALGERRKGCIPLNISGAGFTGSEKVVHISEWCPSGNVLAPEWWVVAATVGVSTVWARRDSSKVWHVVTPDDAPTLTVPEIYRIQAQAFSGPVSSLKVFAYASAQDRLHVFDGTNLRRSGLAAPVAPVVADEGSGSYATTRYFRVRFIDKNTNGVILRRSEPSPSTSLTPSGSGAGAAITKPASLSEHETHWEVEGSLDNASFYLVATLAIATTSYNDTTAAATTYSGGTLSEDIGTYTLLPSARFVGVDGDRLVFGGHQTDSTRKSLVGWTPVSNDPGKGNAERLPTGQNNTVNLDNGDGGEITGIASAVQGTWYAFKWQRVYALLRTNNPTQAYQVYPLSTSHGAVPGSVFVGHDESGAACVYFQDPFIGPCRLGTGGIQPIYGLGQSTNPDGSLQTWARMNLHASLPALGCYYAAKKQAIWWNAFDGADTPSVRLRLQVNEVRGSTGAPTGGAPGGVARGWAIDTGRIAAAFCVGLLTDVVVVNTVDSLSARPCIGLTSPDFLQACDVGSFDAGTTYVAKILSKPYLVNGLTGRWGNLSAAILAGASTTATLTVSLVRDYGLETISVTTGLSPTVAEQAVVKALDDLLLSNATVVQIQFQDGGAVTGVTMTDLYQQIVLADTPGGYWRLHDVVGSTTAADTSGNAHPGSVVGGVAFGQSTTFPGLLSSARLNGTTGYVSVPAASSFTPQVDFSVECWVLVPATSSADVPLVEMFGGSHAFDGFLFALNGDAVSAGRLSLWTGSGWVHGTARVDNNKWHHVAAVLTGANVNFYVDGVLDALTIPTGVRLAPTHALEIGHRYDSGTLSAITITEVAVYTHALIQSQITRHYVAGVFNV